MLTGNPVRQDLCDDRLTRDEACDFFGLDPHKKTILLIGGSLGALTLNTAVVESIPEIVKSGVQLVWQCGKRFDERARAALDGGGRSRPASSRCPLSPAWTWPTRLPTW